MARDAQRAQRRRWTLCACLGGFLLLVAVAIPLITSLALYDSFLKLEELEGPTPTYLESDELIIGFGFLAGAILGLTGVALLLLAVINLSRAKDVTSPRAGDEWSGV